MKEGDKIIWDSGFGYDIGYFIGDSSNKMYYTYLVSMITGVCQGANNYLKHEVKPYDENIDEMVQKYKYLLEF